MTERKDKKMEKLKNKQVGRPKYQPNIEQLQELYKQVADKKITNEERMANRPLWQDQMVSAKKII